MRAGAIYSKREKRYAYSTSSTTADQWLYLYRWGSNMPLGYDDEGDIIRSPHSELSQANTAKREWNYTNINLGATFNIMKDWTLDVDYTYAGEDNIINENEFAFTKIQSLAKENNLLLSFEASGKVTLYSEDGEFIVENY